MMDVEDDGDTVVAPLRDKGKGRAVLPEYQESSGSSGRATADTLPWVEKYRPSTLDDLVSHKDITSTINRFIDENRLPHLLFYGPPGTGKTSTILACARRLYGPRYKSMILELNASDDRGIDVVRDQIKEFAGTRMLFSSGFKLIILDEADAMTNPAQAALRRVIEKYTKNVRFCLICNYVSRIIPALQSRCTRFRFSPLEDEQITSRLDYIITQEKLIVKPDGKAALMRLANGDMRKVLNILQATAAAFDVVDGNAVYSTTGSPFPSDVEDVLAWLLGEDFMIANTRITSLKFTRGLALADLVRELHALVAQLEIPARVRVHLFDALAEAEYNISRGCGEKLQLGGIVGAFQQAREMISAIAAQQTAAI